MSVVATFALIAAGLLALAVLAAAPLLLPWGYQLRLITSLHDMGCAWTSAATAQVCLDEVVPLEVRAGRDRIAVWLLTQPVAAIVTVEAPRSPATLDLLLRWVQRGESVLLTTTADGQASLSTRSESLVLLPAPAALARERDARPGT